MEFFFLYRQRERDRSLRRGSSIILFWSSRQTRCGVGAVLTRCSLQSSVSQQQVAKSTCACVYIAPRMKSRQSTGRQGRCGWTKKSPAWRLVGLKSNRIKTFLGYESASLDYRQSGKQVRILCTSFSTPTSSFFSGGEYCFLGTSSAWVACQKLDFSRRPTHTAPVFVAALFRAWRHNRYIVEEKKVWCIAYHLALCTPPQR